jgi:hypothetical protein
VDDNQTMAGQQWARAIQEGASDREVRAVVGAINALAASRRANRASVMVACAQILARNITAAPRLSSEIRAGVMALLDGFTMRSAVEEAEHGS